MIYTKKIVKQNPLTELNQFLLQVKQVFTTDDLNQVDELLKDQNQKKIKEPLQEILENAPRIDKAPKIVQQDDVSSILYGLTTLLEKNLQESQNLQSMFQNKKEVKQPIQSPLPMITDDQGAQKLQSEIYIEEKKLLRAQNERLLEKIELLNEQITDLETNYHIKQKNEKDLIQLINLNFVIQRTQYKQDFESPYVEDGILFVQEEQLAICQDYLTEQKVILGYSQILDVSYDSEFQIILHYDGGVLVLRMQNPYEFAKVDLALWAAMRKNIAINQMKFFDNPLFERPFNEEQFVLEHKVLREQYKILIPNDMKSSGPLTDPVSKIEKMDSPTSIDQQQKPSPPFLRSQTPPPPPPKAHNQAPGSYIIQSSPDETVKLQHALSLLKQGFCMVKYSKGQRKPNLRLIYLTQNEQLLRWKEPLQPFDKKDTSSDHSILLETIKEIKDVGQGPGFVKFQKTRIGKEELGITVIGSRNLELDAPTQEDKALFLECVRLAIKNPKIMKNKK